jgi:hypothetical protein
MALSELWFDVMCDSINRALTFAVANENGVVEDENLSVVDVAEVDAFSVVEELDIVIEVEEDEENDIWDFKIIVSSMTKFNVFYCGMIVLLFFYC